MASTSDPDRLTEAEVNKIGDLFQAFQWIQKLGVDPRGITDLEDAKCRLLQYLQQAYGAGQHKRGNVSEIMREVLEQDRKLRTELVQLYHEVEAYVIQLPVMRRRELDRSIPEVGEQIHQNVSSLERSECHILVAGEVSAGKSSLLNLILGIDLLPTSLLSCTSTMCELRYGETRYALAYSVDSSQSAERIDLSVDQPADVLARYVHQRGNRKSKFPYRRVEIYWPFPLLQGGIVIVDSPGIGESREMTKMVKTFLPTAFAFIYVINSSNAGGLQPDRLQDLLAEISRQNEDHTVFNPRSAIFVCNKWDQVPPDEAEQVRADTRHKLKLCWAGVHHSQIFEMSTIKAKKSLHESGYVTQDLSRLLEGIEALLPISLRCKLEVHYRWLSHVLRRSAFYLRVHIANETRSDEDRKELTEHLTNQLDRLDTEAQRVIAELKADVYGRAQSACDDLIAHLDSAATRGRLLMWQESECPDGSDWDVLHEVLIAKVNKRIRREVNDWDTRNGVFQEIQMSMLHKFQQEFELMEDQLSVIEGGMMGSRSSARVDAQAALRHLRLQRRPSLTKGQKIALGLAAPILLPLGVVAGFFMLPVAGIRAVRSKLAEIKLLKSYRENKEKALTTMTQDILNTFIDKGALSRLIREQLQVVTANMEKMLSAIPNIIEADRLLIERLQEERNQSEVALAEQLLPMYRACVEHQGRLDLFYARKIRTYDVDFADLDWDPARPPLASGSFGDVYEAVWRNGSVHGVHVAVKVRREALDESNVTELLVEEENLRKLHHDNIVVYYGTCARRQGPDGTLQVLMLMEKCEVTLRSRIVGEDSKNPGRLGDNRALQLEATRRVRSYCKQLCAALMYIHDRGLVHRDLKPQNILLNKLEMIKIADVGLTKPERDISGTVCGTTAYSAPEVLEGVEYNKAADMYSFAMITWELWYGRTVADELSGLHKGSLETVIRAGTRPAFHVTAPAEEWRDVIELSWNADPKKRLPASHCFDFFDSLKDI